MPRQPDGRYRSEEAVARRKQRLAEKQASGRFNQTKKDYIARNPEKRAAHIAVGNAVRDGKLVKPKSCPKCGRETLIIGHHSDYSQPLDVEWMCGKCHRAEHVE